MRFKNRKQAGRLLAQILEKYKGEDAVIYALPRGGVEVCSVTESGHLVCNEEEAIGLLERFKTKEASHGQDSH
jgi:hypothetical protein